MIYEGIDIWNSPYLEHHGVKGMKWGVRKQRELVGSRNRNAKSLRNARNSSAKQSFKRGAKRAAIILGAGAAAGLVTVGAIIAARNIRENGDYYVDNIKEGAKYIKDLMTPSKFSYTNTTTGKTTEAKTINSKNIKEAMFETSDAMKKTPVKSIAKNIKSAATKAASNISTKMKDSAQRRFDNSDYAKARSLSDDELHKRINRINLEQQYINAINRDRSAEKQARRSKAVNYAVKAAAGIGIMSIGQNVARNYITNKINDKFPTTRKPKQSYKGKDAIKRAKEEARKRLEKKRK